LVLSQILFSFNTSSSIIFVVAMLWYFMDIVVVPSVVKNTVPQNECLPYSPEAIEVLPGAAEQLVNDEAA
jgi:hypothetical protein